MKTKTTAKTIIQIIKDAEAIRDSLILLMKEVDEKIVKNESEARNLDDERYKLEEALSSTLDIIKELIRKD